MAAGTHSKKNNHFLQLLDLSKGYMEGRQQRPVLKEASVGIEQGAFTAILGKSGSGKTTLLNLISGIDKPDSGTIYFDDICLSGLDDLQSTLFRRRQIGFIFQFFNLIQTLTVWENITLPLELNDMLDDTGRQHAEMLLEQVGLLDRRKTYPDRLSGGEQQRVAIARALVHQPSLVLADEPTGNLDEKTGEQILRLLDNLTRKAGRNLILVTHNPEAAAYADRILLLQDGKLVDKESLKG